ncbi:MAG: hypothetical protein K0B52_06365 [FCB group bacterium]|nr:hypothetical protein [FCB group bacterium]
MFKKIILLIGISSCLFAGEGLPVLLFPTMAQDGYFPSIPQQKEDQINFSYANWYYDTDYSAVSVNYRSYTFGFKGLISGNIDIRGDVPADEAVGVTSYYNSVLYAGKTLKLSDRWRLNTVANLLTERLFYATSWGASLDAEAVWAFNVRYRALVGFENLGMMSPLLNMPTKTPARYYLGTDALIDFILVSLQGGLTRDLDPYFKLGVRYIHPVFDVSYTYDNLNMMHHVGADIKWKNYRIGYGQYLHQRGLGYPMMFTVGMLF